jgi:hypothetical protein
MLRRIALGSLIAVLAAFGPAAASEEDAATLRDYCRSEIAPSGQVCDCLLHQFAKLTDGQQALIRAILMDEAAAIGGLRADLTVAEATQAEGFMARETMLCRPSG